MLRSLQTSKNSTSTLSCLLVPAVVMTKGMVVLKTMIIVQLLYFYHSFPVFFLVHIFWTMPIVSCLSHVHMALSFAFCSALFMCTHVFWSPFTRNVVILFLSPLFECFFSLLYVSSWTYHATKNNILQIFDTAIPSILYFVICFPISIHHCNT